MKTRLALVMIWLLCALAAVVAAKIERLWAADLDFISHGPMPHSVPELRAEFGL